MLFAKRLAVRMCRHRGACTVPDSGRGHGGHVTGAAAVAAGFATHIANHQGSGV
jgi:hypothetical protein